MNEAYIGNLLDITRDADLTPQVAAMRQAVLDELHTRANALNTTH